MSKLKVNAFRSFCAESLTNLIVSYHHLVIINLIACELIADLK